MANECLNLMGLRAWIGRAFVVVPVLLLCAGTLFRHWIRVHSGQMYSYGYAPLIPNLDIFLAGMSINLLPKFSPRKWLGPALAVSCVAFYVLISYVTFYKDRFHIDAEGYWVKVPLLAVLIAVGLIYLAEMTGKIAIRGAVGIFLVALQTIGTVTYCLYVFHPEVFLVNGDLLPKSHSLGVSLHHFPPVIFETFAVAAFFYFAVEKPFDLKKRVNGTDTP